MSPFAVNRQARFSQRAMGRESQPLVIVDEALEAPQTLIEMAYDAPFSAPPGGFYPGLNAPLPRDYVVSLAEALRPLLAQAFELPLHQPVDLSGYFGLATRPAEALARIQRLPHHDSTNPMQLAVIHYLVAGQQGGTGFYRQDATGFETVDSGRQPAYAAECARQIENAPDLTRHVGPQTPGYSLIDAADAVFNRLIIYRTTSLHSGLLETSNLTDNPATGRLTANIFIRPSLARRSA